MNKLYGSLILMVLCLSVSLPSRAVEADSEAKTPWWIELQAVSGKDKPAKAAVWYEKDLTEHLGFYALIEKESIGRYTEAYAGPKFKFSDRLTVGVGIGRETDTTMSAVRKNVYYDANWEKFSSFGTFENGGSGRWHKVTVTYALSDKFGVGVMHETFLGLGPRLEYNIPGTKMQLWGALLHDRDTGKNTSVLAINFSF